MEREYRGSWVGAPSILRKTKARAPGRRTENSLQLLNRFLTLTPLPVPKPAPLVLLNIFRPRCYAIPRDTGRKGKNGKTEIRRWESQRPNPHPYPKPYPAPTVNRTPKPNPHTPNPAPLCALLCTLSGYITEKCT
jgi:hypothetical protein